MRYDYEDLSEDQFERLVVLICQELFGIAVHGFTKGPDGGRDAKFTGTAKLHPSPAAPWVGTTIIQAKHTNGYNCSFSDPDFFSRTSVNCVIAKELPRIKKLRASKELDHYMLFSNRRLTGNTESEIIAYLSAECAIPLSSLHLCDIQQIEILIKRFPEIPRLANLDPRDSPLLVSSDELAEVVEAFAANLNTVIPAAQFPVPRVKYEDKNLKNNMTSEYAKWLRSKYLKETKQIYAFLSDPLNDRILKLYESAVEEFNSCILAKRNPSQTFDVVMNYLFDLLVDRDPVLRRNKRVTRALLFYMYWTCDIGT